MLRAWRDFVVCVDPDILTGYNIVNFDLVYLIKRANHISVPKFAQLGRLKRVNAKIKSTTFSSKQMGNRESKDIVFEGRVQLDAIQAITRDYKLSSYSLNSVSSHFLGEQKENVHHSIITQLYDGDDSTRRRLAVYCLKDAYLPQRLLDKLMIMINYIEMARVTGIPLSFILERGQQIKVVSQLLRKAKDKAYIMPTPVSKESTFWNGGKVFEPKTGY
jgi:DNA polymerase delta subunit 1